jgi:hypothetical protein
MLVVVAILVYVIVDTLGCYGYIVFQLGVGLVVLVTIGVLVHSSLGQELK